MTCQIPSLAYSLMCGFIICSCKRDHSLHFTCEWYQREVKWAYSLLLLLDMISHIRSLPFHIWANDLRVSAPASEWLARIFQAHGRQNTPKKCSRVESALASYLGTFGFKPQSTDRLFSLKVSWFSLVSSGNSEIVLQIGSRLLLAISFPVHGSLIILHLYSTWPKPLKSSTNKG
jgi:hypothetical protein